MVFTNSWTNERYGGIGDHFDSKMNLLEYMKYEMVLMNSCNIEQYGTSVGDDFKMK